MRKCLLTALSLVTITCHAQLDTRVTTSSRDFSWKIGDSRYSSGYIATRLEGANASYKVTNISYDPVEAMIAARKLQAETNLEPDSVWQAYANSVKRYASGGIIALYVRRSVMRWADRSNYTVVIKDSNDANVIFRATDDGRLPDYDDEEDSDADWRQITTTLVNVPLPSKFYVYIIDNYGTADRYKFAVRPSR